MEKTVTAPRRIWHRNGTYTDIFDDDEPRDPQTAPTYGFKAYYFKAYYRSRKFPEGCVFGVDGLATPEAARQRVLDEMVKDGWTPPKWWQFWRANETRI